MIKTITFPKDMKIDDVIDLLIDFRNEQNEIMELQYAEFLCFKCLH